MPLEIQIQTESDPRSSLATIVKLTGSLDNATAPDLARELAPLLNAPIKELVFDLAGLKFISSAGLRVFATTRKPLVEHHAQVSFVNLQPQVKAVFDIMIALPGASVFKDMTELDAFLTKVQQKVAEPQ